MRQILLLLALAVATPAVAAPKNDTNAQVDERKDELKAELKETKKTARQLDRYSRKWKKAVEKDKENKIARFDEKLGGIYGDELARLRAKGVETKVAEVTPVMQHPAHPQKVLPEPPSERTKLESLRDDLVALRDAQRERASGKGRVTGSERKLVGELQRKIEKRQERLDERYEKAKQRAKG